MQRRHFLQNTGLAALALSLPGVLFEACKSEISNSHAEILDFHKQILTGGGGIDGCYDVSELPNITIELFNRGYSESDVKKIWSGNIMRVFKECESYNA